MDWHSRHVLAWKLSNTMDTSFCVAALEEALGKGRPEIFNTDQGSQFTSEAFTQTLQEQRVQVSMDGKGRYLDNIFVERLWRSIKYEEVYLKAYQTVAEARTGINAYLEFYNRQRPHQALGYRTPAEVYQHGQEERGAAAEEAGLPSGLVKPSAGVGGLPDSIMDWHSRHVLAWKLSNTMDTSFCVAALEEALGKGRPEIFNTDQGSQFTSEAFTQTLQEQRVQVSMDGKGRYLDNIFVERLWRSIKYEEVYLKAYQTVAEARTGINAYLEFYNRQRPHQALGYRTPAEVYQHGQEERGAAAEEAGLPSGLVKPSAGVGDSLNLALVLS